MPDRRAVILMMGGMIVDALPSRPAFAAGRLATAEGTPIKLGADPIRIALHREADERRWELAMADGQVNLMLSGLATDIPPIAGFHMFVNPGPKSPPTPSDAGYVGTLNFFAVPAPTPPGAERAVSFQMGDALVALRAVGRLAWPWSFAIVPTGALAEGAHPIIGNISISHWD